MHEELLAGNYMSKKELITLQIDIHSNIELNEFCLKLLKELVI